MRRFFGTIWIEKVFLQALGAACEKTGWQLHAYCWMDNHFHLVVETPQANLVEGMKWLLGTYTMCFNRRHKLSGHLFCRTLQVALGRWSHAGLFAHSVRLRAFESVKEPNHAMQATAVIGLRYSPSFLITSSTSLSVRSLMRSSSSVSLRSWFKCS